MKNWRKGFKFTSKDKEQKERFEKMQEDERKIISVCPWGVVAPKPTNYNFPRFERSELIDTSQTQIFK